MSVDRLVKTPPRPNRTDDFVEKAAAEKILKDVVQWLKNLDSFVDDEAELESIREDLADVLGEDDGYRACRRLETRHHWDCDSALVEILDDAGHALFLAEKAAVEAWVIAYKVAVPFAIGESVRIKRSGKVGTVARIVPATASVTVKLPEHSPPTVGVPCSVEDLEAVSNG